jgi:hypothetical protein
LTGRCELRPFIERTRALLTAHWQRQAVEGLAAALI